MGNGKEGKAEQHKQFPHNGLQLISSLTHYSFEFQTAQSRLLDAVQNGIKEA
jgi:hypothetical protein